MTLNSACDFSKAKENDLIKFILLSIVWRTRICIIHIFHRLLLSYKNRFLKREFSTIYFPFCVMAGLLKRGD